MGTYCRENNCPWYDTFRDVCSSPNDPHGKECDYNWAAMCPQCNKIIAVGDDDDGNCPFCGAELVTEPAQKKALACNLDESRSDIEGYEGRWYRKNYYCPSCGTKIRTESWDEKRCFGISTILKDNAMPEFCPNCGKKIGRDMHAEVDKN